MKHRMANVLREFSFRVRSAMASPDRRPHMRLLHRSEFYDVETADQIDFLHRHGSVHYFERNGIWLVTGFEAAEKVLTDAATFSPRDIEEYRLFDTHAVIIRAEGDRHAMINNLIADAFLIYKDESYLQQIRNRLHSQMAVFETEDSVDLKQSFTDPLATYAFCLLVGFNAKDTETIVARFHDGNVLAFLDWFMSFMETISITEYDLGSAASLLGSIQVSLLNGLITESVARDILKITLVASTETVSSTFQRIIELVLHDEELRERLRKQESIRAKFIDEIVRVHPPSRWLKRKAVIDTEIFGVHIPAGSTLVVDIRAANRDPKIFERPASLHLDGHRHRNLAFGSGVHKCLGMGIARTQARLFLDHFLDKVNDFEMEDIRWMRPRNITIISTESMKIRRVSTSAEDRIQRCPFHRFTS
jgi:cytochrome P450